MSKTFRVFALVLLLVITSCAPMKTATSKTDTFEAYAEQTITNALWIKNVTDSIMEVGCATGKIPTSVCLLYQTKIESYGSILLAGANIALDEYRKGRTDVTQQRLREVIDKIMALVFKMDVVYKTPADQIKTKVSVLDQ